MPTLVDVLKYQLVLDDKQFIAGAQRADATADNLAGTIGGKLTTAVGLLAAAFGALKIGDFLKDATLTAARTEVLGTVLTQVGRNAGVSQGQLALLEEQVKSLGITTQGARESIIKFIQSGLPLTKVAELARLAQDSAVVAGINSAEALDRLVRGIQTGQIELLRSAGVFVSIESELNKFARTSGKAREGLSDLERQTVILNAVLAQGEKLAGNYEASMQNVGKSMTSLPRLFEELQNAIGKFFLPVMEDAVEVLSKLLKNVTDLVTAGEDLAAQEFIKTGGAQGNQIEVLNGLLARQAELKEKILTIEKSLASLQDQPITADSYTDIKALSGYLSATNRALKETERLISAISENAFTGPIDQRAQIAAQEADALASRLAKREEERAKRAAERGKELAKTITIGGDIASGLDRQWEAFVRSISSAPIEAQVKIKIPTAEVAQAQAQIQKIFMSNAPDQGPMFDILDIQSQIEQANRVADATEQAFSSAFDNVYTVATSVLRNIGNEAADVFGSMLASIGNFSTGNIAAGIAGVVDSIFSIFGGGVDKITLSQRDLIRAIEDWRDTVSSVSDRDKAEQQKALDVALRYIATANAQGFNSAGTRSIIEQILASAGINAPENATLQQLIEFMRALQLTLSDTSRSFDAIISATTAQQRSELVTGTRGADDALTVINTLTDIFDLSLEEQQSLLQQAYDDLVARGLLSDQDKAEFFSRIEGLGDSIESLADKQGATQVERSIARVSERQADSLIAGLNTLDLHIVNGLTVITDYLQQMLDLGQNVVAGAVAGGGGTYTIEITNNFSGGNQAEIESTVSKAVEKGIRAVGGTRIGSR